MFVVCPICGGKRAFSTDYFPTITSKAEIKDGGNKWVIYKYDKDKNYGSIHAHEYSKGLVLNFDTGEVINIRTKKVVGLMSEKDLTKLKSKSRFFEQNSF